MGSKRKINLDATNKNIFKDWKKKNFCAAKYAMRKVKKQTEKNIFAMYYKCLYFKYVKNA